MRNNISVDVHIEEDNIYSSMHVTDEQFSKFAVLNIGNVSLYFRGTKKIKELIAELKKMEEYLIEKEN